nr:hypothetical protein [Tanacetum cinerariifolium]
SAPTNNNQRTSSNPRNCQIAQPVMNMGQDRQIQNVGGNGGNQFRQYAGQVAQNQQGFNAWQNGIANQSGTGNVVAVRAEGTRIRNQARCYNCRGLGHIARNCIARPRRRDVAYLQTQLLIAQKEEAEIQLQDEEFDFMAAVGDLDETEEVNANCILMANLQQASTSGTQHDRAPVYDTNGSAEYTDLLEPIPEPKLVPQNDNHVTSVAPSMVHSGGVFVPQTTKSKEELFLSNVSNMVTVSKTISIPNEDLSDDTTPSVARKFLNKVKSSLVTLQRVVKQKMTLEFTIGHLLLTKSLVDVPSDLRTELDRTKEKLELCIIKKEKECVVLWNNCHLKTTYKNLFDSIKSNWAHAKLHDLIFEIAKLRAWLFEKSSKSMKNTSWTSVTSHGDKPKLSAITPLSKKLHASMSSHSVPQPKEFNIVKYRNVIAPIMFKINPSQMPRVELPPNKQSSASIRTNLITNSQRHVIVKENVSSNTVTVSSTGLVHTAKTRRPQPKGNTRNARVLSASKSSEVKKIVTVEDHRRTLLLSKNQKIMSSECNNIKLSIRNDKSKIVCDTCKQCLVTANHDACLTPSVNVLNSHANKLCANVPLSENQKRHKTQVWKPKQVGSKERLASKPRLPRLSLKWSPSGCSFDQKGK